jgi:hypothetical protein
VRNHSEGAALLLIWVINMLKCYIGVRKYGEITYGAGVLPLTNEEADEITEKTKLKVIKDKQMAHEQRKKVKRGINIPLPSQDASGQPGMGEDDAFGNSPLKQGDD